MAGCRESAHHRRAVDGGVAFAQLRPSGPGYAFRHTQPGSTEPIGFSPCHPVEYVVYGVHAPMGTEGVIDSAIREISRASGMRFAYRGPAETPVLREPSPDGVTREPVVIGWARPQDVGRLSDRTAGLADSHYAWNAERGEFEYVSGSIILDTEAAAEMLERVDGRRFVRAVIMHELGHVPGLDHVEDRTQLMYDDNVVRPNSVRVTEPGWLPWAPADAKVRTGVARSLVCRARSSGNKS